MLMQQVFYPLRHLPSPPQPYLVCVRVCVFVRVHVCVLCVCVCLCVCAPVHKGTYVSLCGRHVCSAFGEEMKVLDLLEQEIQAVSAGTVYAVNCCAIVPAPSSFLLHVHFHLSSAALLLFLCLGA